MLYTSGRCAKWVEVLTKPDDTVTALWADDQFQDGGNLFAFLLEFQVKYLSWNKLSSKELVKNWNIDQRPNKRKLLIFTSELPFKFYFCPFSCLKVLWRSVTSAGLLPIIIKWYSRSWLQLEIPTEGKTHCHVCLQSWAYCRETSSRK